MAEPEDHFWSADHSLRNAALHVSSTSCSSSGETNCVNTTSGSCHSVHIRPAHDTATDTEWQLPEVVLTKFISPDEPRSLPTCRQHGHRQIPEVVLTQCVPPDDEHDVLERCRELKIKINTYKRIVRHAGHLPRIIKWCTVNKIYKKEICLQISLLCVMTPLIFLQCPGNSYRLVLSQTSSEFLKAL